MEGEVTVAPEAFASEGVLQSTLDHEGVHVTQIENGEFHAYSLGGHPKPASRGHLKSGQSEG
jgi:hypothetical protein